MIRVSIRQETIALRDRADEDPMPVLDGLHVDQRGDDVLPAPPRFPKADFRPGGVHLHARLGQHGCLHHHTVDPRARPIGHHHRLHLLLHLHYDEATKIRRTDTRQGVRDRAFGKPEQSESHHVLCPGDGFLGVLGTVCRSPDIHCR